MEALLKFLLESPSESPLPILGDDKNRVRLDPDDAIEFYGVYRDPWERPIPVRDKRYRKRCTKESIDYPEIADEMRSIEAFHRRREGDQA